MTTRVFSYFYLQTVDVTARMSARRARRLKLQSKAISTGFRDPGAAARGAGADRGDPRQVRRSRERPLDRSPGRAKRAPAAVRALPRPAAHLPGSGMTEAPPAPRYEPISVGDQSTVVAEFVPTAPGQRRTRARRSSKRRSSSSSRVRPTSTCAIPSESALVANLRAQLEALNAIEFSDDEWQRFFAEKIAGANEGIVEKTARIQEDHVQVLDARRRHVQERPADRQAEHPQQPAAGDQPVRGRSPTRRSARDPLRRHDPRQRPAARARRAQAARRGHPGGVQPDQPLPARQLLVRLRPVRVRAALRDQQRHAHEVLLEHDARLARRRAGRRAKQAEDVEHASSSRAGGRTRGTGRSPT